MSRKGRYKLKVPAGKWALRSSVVELGKPFAAFTSAAIVAKSGQRRTLPLTLKRFKKPRRKRAHTANINQRDGRPYPGEAFGTERFTVVGGGSPPNGAPPGTYRTFSVSSGGVDITLDANPPGGCTLRGSGHVDFVPGLLSQVVVQLDVPNPAYGVHLARLASDTITATRSGGAGCTGITPVPIFTELASTGSTTHTSPSYALEGSQAMLTPESPFDYDYTTRWSFAPVTPR